MSGNNFGGPGGVEGARLNLGIGNGGAPNGRIEQDATYGKEYAETIWWHTRTFLQSAHFADIAKHALIGAAGLAIATTIGYIVMHIFHVGGVIIATPILGAASWGIGKLYTKVFGQ